MAELSRRASNKGQCIDFDFFRSKMWSRLQQGAGTKASASAVWTELVSHITGSTDALRSGGALSEEQYSSPAQPETLLCLLLSSGAAAH